VGQTRVTLIFFARNGYVTGWFNEQTRQYVRLGAGPGGMPGQNGRTDDRDWLNYETYLATSLASERNSSVAARSPGVPVVLAEKTTLRD